MTKVSKAANTVSLENITSIGKDVSKGTRVKSIQNRLERMQLDIAKKTVSLDKQVESALKEQKAAKERANELKRFKLTPVSSFDVLNELYNERLSGKTAKDFKEEAALDAVKFITNATKNASPLNDDQIQVVNDYYLIKAETSVQKIEAIRSFLALKGYKVPKATSGAKPVRYKEKVEA